MIQQAGFLSLVDAVDRLREALATNKIKQAFDIALLCAAQSKLIAARIRDDDPSVIADDDRPNSPEDVGARGRPGGWTGGA